VARGVARLPLLLLALLLTGCAGAAASAWPPREPGLRKDVWVVRHGWHTRVAVARADVDPAVWPDSSALGDVRYLEVGWGDRDFYPDPQPSLWDALDPVVRCTPAAMHVGGFDVPPAAFLPGTPIVRLALTPAGFDRLTAFIQAHYVRRDDAPVAIRPGTYPRSVFYLAHGRYHVLRNSNHWTARALQAAGVPMAPWRALTAHSVIAQAEQAGERVDRAARRDVAGPSPRVAAP
jgi:uncharacterized protein (TIGR02117 family)